MIHIVWVYVFSMLSNYYVLYAFHCFPIKDYDDVDVLGHINHHSRLMLPYYRYIPRISAHTHTDTYLYTFISISACFVYGFTIICIFTWSLFFFYLSFYHFLDYYLLVFVCICVCVCVIEAHKIACLKVLTSIRFLIIILIIINVWIGMMLRTNNYGTMLVF